MRAITDHDVGSVARTLGLELGAQDVAFLKSAQSVDVHACPGGGKTTLLVAKLAILARHWTARDKGILVLSHTNVARSEVQRRLARDPAAAKLLAYPHFIGTIQAFVDRFLAFPYLRDVGVGGYRVPEPRVDDDLFAARAWAAFDKRGWRDFKQARGYLGRRHDLGRKVVTSLHYRGASREVFASESVPGAGTPTGAQLRQLKDELARDGVFRFADMFAFAAAAIIEHLFLPVALRSRFPWVFIDEVQDTDATQETLLDGIFSEGSIVQKLGDRNQGIFRDGDDDPASLPWKSSLELPRSHRLSPRIANVCSRLTAVHRQQIEGNPRRAERRHTLFVFSDSSIHRVLAAYGDLILSEWPASLPSNFVAKAVGFRRRARRTASSEALRKPDRISDYWPEFPADCQLDRMPRRSLVEAALWARHAVGRDGAYHRAYKALIDGAAQLIEHHRGERITGGRVADMFRSKEVDEKAVRAVFAEILRTARLDAASWSGLTGRLAQALNLGDRASNAAAEYLRWRDGGSVGASLQFASSATYRHVSGARSVDIEVGTIHSVKGETHHATLVLETFDHEHDMAAVIPRLCGETQDLATSKRETKHMKRMFVAMTRPMELLCGALHRDHVSAAQRAALTSAGWCLVDLDADQ